VSIETEVSRFSCRDKSKLTARQRDANFGFARKYRRDVERLKEIHLKQSKKVSSN
jgi:hypothetical protein